MLQVRIAVLLLAARRMLGRQDTTATLRRLAPGARWRSFAPDEGLRAVRRASRALRANCLTQSVALAVACERAGLHTQVILGCRRYAGGQWGAHAWVMIDGRAYDPLPSGEHQSLAAISADTQWVPAPISRGVD